MFGRHGWARLSILYGFNTVVGFSSSCWSSERSHQSCTQLDKMLVASWSRTLAVVAYSSVLHSTKSSAYIADFMGMEIS